MHAVRRVTRLQGETFVDVALVMEESDVDGRVICLVPFLKYGISGGLLYDLCLPNSIRCAHMPSFSSV